MSSITSQFEYFEFVSTPEKQDQPIIIPGAPMKKYSNDSDSENEQDNYYSLVHPWTLDEPMTIEELNLDSDSEEPISPYVTIQRGVSYWNYTEDSLLGSPMSIDDSAEYYPNVTMQRGVAYLADEEDHMSIDDLAEYYPNVTMQRGVAYLADEEEDSLLGSPMSIDELATDEEDDAICLNLQYDFENSSL
jgi:hypothetical protein